MLFGRPIKNNKLRTNEMEIEQPTIVIYLTIEVTPYEFYLIIFIDFFGLHSQSTLLIIFSDILCNISTQLHQLKLLLSLDTMKVPTIPMAPASTTELGVYSKLRTEIEKLFPNPADYTCLIYGSCICPNTAEFSDKSSHDHCQRRAMHSSDCLEGQGHVRPDHA
jgi:hypothetical protein